MKTKRGTAPPKANDVNPYMIARKSAMMAARVTAQEVWDEHANRVGTRKAVSIATVHQVIRGIFRNDAVIDVLCSLTGVGRAALFPATELEWIAEHRRAERSAIEATG